MPRGQATLLLALALVSLVGAVAVGTASAQDATAGAKTRTITIYPATGDACPSGKSPCWDLTRIPVLAGDNIAFVANLTTDKDSPHDLHVFAPVDKTMGGKGVTSGKDPSNFATGEVLPALNFTFPTGRTAIDFECALHATMTGQLVLASALGAAEAKAVPELGVHFLSYWVGVIAFMIMFVVYGATFFLFKYNETPATTDQWERAGEGTPDMPRRFGAGAASLLAIVIAAVVIAAIIFLARR